MLSNRSQSKTSQDTLKQHIAQQQTRPYPTLSTPHEILTTPVIAADDRELMLTDESKKKTRSRVAGTIVVGAIALILYFAWQPTTPTSQVAANTQNTIGTTPEPPSPGPTDTSSNTGSDIQVYIIGAVQHPGVYTLASSARVYQLLQAAGGALTNANLTVINMAARLSDGQEIYVPHIGETPIASMSGTINSTPSSTGTTDQSGLVNINSASADQLKQSLHLSSKSAQSIITYRLQHGAFSSVDALAQVLSKAVYDKIKDKVTI